jgi:hypothetical protein
MRTSSVRSRVSRTRVGRSLAAAGAAILLGGLLAAIVPATAAAHNCTSGNFCAYDSNSCAGHGQNHEVWASQSFNWPGHIDDQEDCVRNNGTIGHPVAVYDGTSHSDFHYCINQGHTVTLPTNKDGDGNSHRWESGRDESSCF